MPQQTVLVTGGASGIGLAVVEAALAAGWRVAAVDLQRAALTHERLRCEQLDVTDEAAVVRALAAIEAEFGPLAGVVNSAGIGRDVPALDTGADLFRRILDVNLVGSFVVAREAARLMRPRGQGSIVNIASVSGLKGNRGRVAYGASKAGVINMTQVMAVELAPSGLRVNAIAPGPIDTPLAREVHTPAMRAAWTGAVPQRRYGMPEDVAQMALFLLDPAKSGYITGQTINVDGGFSTAGITI
jgi:NAD(P)-dependent dehydrogenase (short-subunit alcohol dehydrogenase family)